MAPSSRLGDDCELTERVTVQRVVDRQRPEARERGQSSRGISRVPHPCSHCLALTPARDHLGDHVAEMAMDGRIVGQLGVEGGDEHEPALRHHRLAPVLGQRLYVGTETPDARRADEDHLDRDATTIERGDTPSLEGLALAAIGIALDANVDETEGELARVVHVSCQQDEPGARAEDRLALGVVLLERREEPPGLDQLEQGRTLAAGNDETVDVPELLRLTDIGGLDHTPRERLDVKREITLEGENTNSHACLSHLTARLSLLYHPLVCSSSLSAILEI